MVLYIWFMYISNDFIFINFIINMECFESIRVEVFKDDCDSFRVI